MMTGGVWVGGYGSGKSRALREAVAGDCSDRVLVLLPHRPSASAWQPRRTQTFTGWVWDEVSLHWPLIEPHLLAGESRAAPRRLPTAALVHLLAQEAGRLRDGGGLAGLPLPPERIGSLLARGLHQGAALTGLTPEELASRLALALDGWGAAALPREVSQLLQGIRHTLEQARVLDTGLAAGLWQRYLLPDSAYRQSLLARWEALVADDLAEQPPLVLDLIALFRQGGRPVWVAYDSGGGYDLERGAAGAEVADHPALAGLPLHRLPVPGAPPGHSAAPPSRPAPRITQVETDLRGDLIRKVAAAVQERLAAGIPPGEIAILAPRIDAGLQITLERCLQGCLPEGAPPVTVLPPVSPLAERPGARTLLTLARLAYPDWQLPPAPDEVAQALQLALGIDPVRARAVAAAYQRLGRLPAPGAAAADNWRPSSQAPEDWVVLRLGPEVAERYRSLLTFLGGVAGWPPSLFLARAAEAWIFPHSGAPALLPACRQLIHLAQTLESLAEWLPLLAYPSPGWHLARVAGHHHVATEPPAPGQPGPGVWLATPTAFLALDRTVAVQVWVDAGSMGWLPGPVHPLANPHPLRRSWPPDQPWSDAQHRQEQERRLRQLTGALLARCRQELILASSALDARGQECDGPLAAYVLARSGPEKASGEEVPHGRPLAL